MDDRNLYAAPAAEVVQAQGPAGRTDEFYVVSMGKFALLFFGTVSLYQLYWFYAHWSRYRRTHQLSLWPVPRAIFSLFFAHSLANRIEESLRGSRSRFDWTPALPATVYVIAQLISNLADRIPWPSSVETIATTLTLLMVLPSGWALARMQRAANAACADPQGESNRRLTPVNYLWIVLGAALWLVMLLGLLVMFMPGEFGE
ncbi:MAG: hypothetical protein ACREP7_01905 [Lysobacter sp.]